MATGWRWAVIPKRLLDDDERFSAQGAEQGMGIEQKLERLFGHGVLLIAEERARQAEHEGYSDDHDDEHTRDELALAAACYAAPAGSRPEDDFGLPDLWPFDWADWSPCPGDRLREVVKAGALLAAEADRLLRKLHRDDTQAPGKRTI